MLLIPDATVFQKRLASLPLSIYQAGETVVVAGSRTDRQITSSSIDWQYVTNTATTSYHIDRSSGLLTSDMNGTPLMSRQCQPTKGF